MIKDNNGLFKVLCEQVWKSRNSKLLAHEVQAILFDIQKKKKKENLSINLW